MHQSVPQLRHGLHARSANSGRWLAWLAICVAIGTQAVAQTTVTGAAQEAQGSSGPLRLRQPATAGTEAPTEATTPAERQLPADRRTTTVAVPTPAPYKPGEFELYVKGLPGQTVDVRRFGFDLITATTAPGGTSDPSPIVPPDYSIQPGDELVVTIWGAVDADLRLMVDRSGRISIPRVGPVMVSGVRFADLADTISRRVALVFKNFQLSVSLGRLRGVRVYVTGFVPRPGVQVLSSLSTLAQALMQAGGPASNGSFRDVQLRRGRELVSTFDLYDLLLKGDRSADRLVQPDDVIHVGPVGAQVAMIGSFNRPAVFELKAGETLEDALRMAGGLSAVADTSRLAIERLDERATVRVSELKLQSTAAAPLRNGDVVRAFNTVSLLLPLQRQNKRVRIEGEVAQPGEYVLPSASTLGDALRIAGGLSPAAYVFGAELTREGVRVKQVENYDRALRDLETNLARETATQRISSTEQAASQAAASQNLSRLIDRLRSIKPTGRIVLQLSPDSKQLPELALEDGDRLYVPARPTEVGVFGSVFNAGSYLYSSQRSLGDYLRLAGGPTKGADNRSIFVIRANGSVYSALESSSWFSRSSKVEAMSAEPGDTIFVPEETDKSSFVQGAKDWTQVFFQLGVGIAGIKSALP